MADTERTESIGLGFAVADAASPALHLDGQVLTVRFIDWQDQEITATCHNVVGLRWQEAEHFVDEGDRYDGTHVVHGSRWLTEHREQDILFGPEEFRHFKLNFNAAGILEILCTSIDVAREPVGGQGS